MNTQTITNTQRRPWLAVLLSLLMPGLGQLYCGATIKCLWIAGLMNGIGILSLLAISATHASSFHSFLPTIGIRVAVCLALALLVYAFSVIDAIFTARRTREDYKLKDYNRWYAYVLFWAAVTGGYLFAAIYVRDNLLEAFVVPGASMYPAILPGDHLLAARNVYWNEDPHVGDIVIFRDPRQRTRFLIKRVIALQEDSVEIRDGELYVNDVLLKREEAPAPDYVIPQESNAETYFYEINRDARYRICLAAKDAAKVKDFPKTIVPKYECFVLGDNRDNSEDSRFFGAIPIVGIIGKASFIYEPSGDWARVGNIE